MPPLRVNDGTKLTISLTLSQWILLLSVVIAAGSNEISQSHRITSNTEDIASIIDRDDINAIKVRLAKLESLRER